MLDFNGDLYEITVTYKINKADYNQIRLINNKVIDIDDFCYITENNLYHYDTGIITEDEHFIRIKSIIIDTDIYTCASTINTLYILRNFINIIRIIHFENIIDMHITHAIIILQANGKVIEFKFNGEMNEIFNDGKELRGDIIVDNNICYIKQYSYLFGSYYGKIPFTDKLYFHPAFGNLSLCNGTITVKTLSDKKQHFNNVKNIFPAGSLSFFIIQ